jgi:hypothetical protein
MPESIEDFLGIKNKIFTDVNDSHLSCQTCELYANSGKLDEDSMILYYTCPMGHQSKVKL